MQGKRIGKVVGIAMDNDRMIQEYESLTSELLRWIESTISSLGDRHFANSLTGVQGQLSQFNNYRTVEKPPKYVTCHLCFPCLGLEKPSFSSQFYSISLNAQFYGKFFFLCYFRRTTMIDRLFETTR